MQDKAKAETVTDAQSEHSIRARAIIDQCYQEADSTGRLGLALDLLGRETSGAVFWTVLCELWCSRDNTSNFCASALCSRNSYQCDAQLPTKTTHITAIHWITRLRTSCCLRNEAGNKLTIRFIVDCRQLKPPLLVNPGWVISTEHRFPFRSKRNAWN